MPLRIGRALGVGHRDQAVGDLLGGRALGDLADDLLGEVGQLVEALGGALLGLRAADSARYGTDSSSFYGAPGWA